MFTRFVEIDAFLNDLLPAAGTVAIWAALSGVISMFLYRLLSPQKTLKELKTELKTVQKELSRYDGELAGGMVLIRRNLALSFKQIGLILAPTLLAIIPVIYILFWCSHLYEYRFPYPGEQVFVNAPPLQAAPFSWPHHHTATPILGPDNVVLYQLPAEYPIPLRHKKQWWNTLLPNPIGYLPAESVVEEIHLEFQKQELLSLGPDWMRGWLAVFITSLVAVSLAIKIFFRIE